MLVIYFILFYFIQSAGTTKSRHEINHIKGLLSSQGALAANGLSDVTVYFMLDMSEAHELSSIQGKQTNKQTKIVETLARM